METKKILENILFNELISNVINDEKEHLKLALDKKKLIENNELLQKISENNDVLLLLIELYKKEKYMSVVKYINEKIEFEKEHGDLKKLENDFNSKVEQKYNEGIFCYMTMGIVAMLLWLMVFLSMGAMNVITLFIYVLTGLFIASISNQFIKPLLIDKKKKEFKSTLKRDNEIFEKNMLKKDVLPNLIENKEYNMNILLYYFVLHNSHEDQFNSSIFKLIIENYQIKEEVVNIDSAYKIAKDNHTSLMRMREFFAEKKLDERNKKLLEIFDKSQKKSFPMLKFD